MKTCKNKHSDSIPVHIPNRNRSNWGRSPFYQANQCRGAPSNTIFQRYLQLTGYLQHGGDFIAVEMA
jgi:hypothetical protein